MKKMIIMRGLPGSGKSYLAKQIQSSEGGIILSTDDLFTVNNHYLWSPKVIGVAHQINQEKTREACKRDIHPIIIDNTNIEKWQYAPYVDIAKEFSYEVIIKESQSPWAWNVPECHSRCTHSVPLDTLYKMLEHYER